MKMYWLFFDFDIILLFMYYDSLSALSIYNSIIFTQIKYNMPKLYAYNLGILQNILSGSYSTQCGFSLKFPLSPYAPQI